MDNPELTRLRQQMVEDYIINRGIQDLQIIRAMRKVPRHQFVDQALWGRAYGDYALPIGEKQTISQPYIIARTTQALRLQGSEKLLEIGTGSGYQTAILAEIADHIFSIEKIPVLAKRARRILDMLGYHNIATRIKDGSYGWKEEAPFDAIFVSAASSTIPDQLLAQIKIGGRLVMPYDDKDGQVLICLEKTESGWNKQSLDSCRFVPLIGSAGGADIKFS